MNFPRSYNEMLSLYDDYEAYVEKYQREYGKNTIVLYQCGGFYEIYAINDGNVDIKEIAELLNVQVSKRNKNIIEVSRSNSLMAGWPHHANARFVPILIENNYTVVIVDQVSPPPNPKRAVTQVLSKGTSIDSFQTQQDSRYIMTFFFDCESIGVTLIDVSTGVNHVASLYAKPNDPSFARDEAIRISMQYKPCEVVWVSEFKCQDYDHNKFEGLVREFRLNNAHNVNWLSKLDKDSTVLSLQNKLLSQVFPHTGMLTPIEYIGLERDWFALISYITMIRYICKHNESLLAKLAKPMLLTPSELQLSYNAAEQLDADGLLNILNQSSTAMGKRYFKYRLMHPMTDPDEIMRSHDAIHAKLECGFDSITKERQTLKKVYDLERLFRKIHMKRLHPSEICNIVSSFDVLDGLLPLQHNETVQRIANYIREKVNLEEIQKYTLDDMTGNFFTPGTYKDIDDLQDEIQSIKVLLQNVVNDEFNHKSKTTHFKLDSNDRDGYFVTCTWKRYKEVAHLLQLDKSVKVSQQTTSAKIHHPILDNLSTNLRKVTNDLEVLIKKEYLKFLVDLSDKFTKEFTDIVYTVNAVDFVTTCAHIAYTYRYCRPTVVCDRERAFVESKELRHPIVERIKQDTLYVGNDVSLGSWLLYGLNAAGKSTLMKSIAISVWMAQAGMYVAATSFTLQPYRAIFTRITQGDDIYTGQSTFMIEMNELRNIITRCDKDSLVIGDELCSGTESASAIGIVSAGVVTLCKLQSSFVFATHLHDLTKIKGIEELHGNTSLQIKHLHVEYDPISQSLVYDRKLRDGQGPTTYGIEVCRALNLGHEFIELANVFRKEYLKESTKDTLSQRPSQYNQHVRVATCSVCKKEGQEVHHIWQQKEADDGGFIGAVHKNHPANLVVLCEYCHDQVHNGNLKIHGYHATSDGVRLSFDAASDSDTNRDGDMQRVLEMRYDKKMSFAAIAKELSISVYRVKRLLSGNGSVKV
jgi:DNA mismatch repair protein MutS